MEGDKFHPLSSSHRIGSDEGVQRASQTSGSSSAHAPVSSSGPVLPSSIPPGVDARAHQEEQQEGISISEGEGERGSDGEQRRTGDRGGGEGTRSTGPVSSYYTGPPSKFSFFGKKQVGVIGEHLPMEIVRIERDYSLAPSHIPQFHPTFPLELEGRITPTHFSELINDINELLIQANDPGWAALDNMLAVMTLWLTPWVLGSRYQRKSRELVRLLEDRNRTLLNPSGLNLLHPSSKAWLYLELEYY